MEQPADGTALGWSRLEHLEQVLSATFQAQEKLLRDFEKWIDQINATQRSISQALPTIEEVEARQTAQLEPGEVDLLLWIESAKARIEELLAEGYQGELGPRLLLLLGQAESLLAGKPLRSEIVSLALYWKAQRDEARAVLQECWPGGDFYQIFYYKGRPTLDGGGVHVCAQCRQESPEPEQVLHTADCIYSRRARVLDPTSLQKG